jgi:hypothetical protein
MSKSNEARIPHIDRSNNRLAASRARFEAQAKRYRELAESADPEFKKKYLDLALSIDAFLKTLPLSAEGAE